jgi:hypothetical protein
VRPQRHRTVYFSESGTLMILAETYFVLVRMSDGHSQRFMYSNFERKTHEDQQ